jgi:hypothetical protein
MLKRNYALACMLALTLVFAMRLNVCFALDQSQAQAAVANADGGLASAYVAVAEAEQAGGNVTQLVASLQVAGGLLDDAHDAYRLGDYDAAYSSASNCSSEVVGIASQAANLKVQAEQARSNALFFTVALSSVVLSVFFVLSLLGWRYLKNRYEKRVLGLRPELR